MKQSYKIPKEYSEALSEGKHEFHRAIDSTNKFLGIVSNNLNVDVFEEKKTIWAIEYLLGCKKGSLYLLFRGESKEDKPSGLVKLISRFGNVRISDISILPEMQCLVTDDTVLFQKENHSTFPSSSSDLHVRRGNPKRAYGWQCLLKEMYRGAKPY